MPRSKPEQIRQNPVLERMWSRMNLQDLNLVCAVVGPTGAGKSLTTASISMTVDPSYGIDDVCWEPLEFLEAVQDQSYKTGDMISFEEGGVSMDAREYWKAMNKSIDKVFQTWRHQNRGAILNLPSLDLLDKRVRKRLHYVFIAVKRTPDFVVLKCLRVKESKTSGDLKFHYPTFNDSRGNRRRLKYIRVGLPPEGFIEEFRHQEREFKKELAEEKYEEMKRELGQGDANLEGIAEKVRENLEKYTGQQAGGNQKWLNKRRVYHEFQGQGVTLGDVDQVKDMVYSELGLHDDEVWV